MRRLFLIIPACLVMSAFADKDDSFYVAVRKSVSRQMKEYPESTLKDLYKSFFQDRFGSGHIISDTAAVKKYLFRELDSYSTVSGKMIEPTGWQHNFYRVNLGAVKNNLIAPEVLLNAFIRSANEAEPVTIEEWRNEWAKIEAIIRAMNLTLPEYETDCREINDKLQKGNYVGHHSEAYNRAYKPHYRIVSKKIVEEKIRPLLEQNRKRTNNNKS